MKHNKLMAAVKSLLGAALLVGTVTVTAQAADPVKVSFVYVSPGGDAGWTYQHDLGRKALEEKFGDKIKVKAVDSVPEGAEAERVIREMAADGSKIVFATSFGFMNPTLKVAKAFPDVAFDHATGYKTADNVGIYNARFYEGRYLAGMIAGGMTKTNVLGDVAAFPIPEVIQGINAYTRGALAVNPNVKMKVVWVNSWFDPGREREAAVALMDQGADVITHHTDSTAVVAAAEEKGKYAVAYNSDMKKYGPKSQLTAVTHHWEKFYTEEVQKVLDGNWKPGNLWGGIKEGMVSLAPLSEAVPADLKAKVEQATKDMAEGKLHPFAGPVLDQDGNEKVPAGKNMDDEALAKMDFYVKGVEGKLPK